MSYWWGTALSSWTTTVAPQIISNFFLKVFKKVLSIYLYSYLLERKVHREERQNSSIRWFTSQEATMATAGTIQSQEQGASPSLPLECIVLRLCAILNCIPKLKEGTWMRSGAARTRINLYIGLWRSKLKNLGARILCWAKCWYFYRSQRDNLKHIMGIVYMIEKSPKSIFLLSIKSFKVAFDFKYLCIKNHLFKNQLVKKKHCFSFHLVVKLSQIPH